MQHLLGRARWDTDGVRDDLRDYVTTHLGDGDGVLVVDETDDLKKGSATVGSGLSFGEPLPLQLAIFGETGCTYLECEFEAAARSNYYPKLQPPHQ